MRALVVIPVTAVAFIIGSAVIADEVLRLPTTDPPVQVIATIDKRGRIVIRAPVVEYGWKESKVKANGLEITKLVNERRRREETITFETKQLQVFGTDGKEIDPKTLADRMKGEVPALCAHEFDPLHLRVIKDGTLVFVFRLPILVADKRYSRSIKFEAINVSIPIKNPGYYLRSDGNVANVEAHRERLFREIGILPSNFFYSNPAQNGVTTPIWFADGKRVAFICAKEDQNPIIAAARLEHEKYHALLLLEPRGVKALSAAIKEKGFELDLSALEEELAATVVEILTVHLLGVDIEQIGGSEYVVKARDLLLKSKRVKRK